ncbi:MAG: hypothetical protein NVS3B26_17840 [Mycobacteriales bacterium]
MAADSANERIVLDARDVKVICSAGLGLLAAVGLVARRRGAQVEVVNCEPDLRGLLRAARLATSSGDSLEAVDGDVCADWTPWCSGAAANA